MRIVVIKEMSAGNESVGEMWKETRIFDANDSLLEVMKWVKGTKINVTITVPENDYQEYFKLF